jgi:alpha-tubulin suppressor-like RCC1 family protein
MKASLLSQNFDALPIRLRSYLAAAALLALPGALMAELSATFNAASDVPVTASSYSASGAVDFTLNFAPEPGTNLTVVKNTGLPFIEGTFSNLANGATVNLSHNGTTYPFVAWYYGGDGNNDLVLLWPYTKVAAWGKNDSGQVGDGTVGLRYAPVAIDEVGLKTIVQVVAAGDSSFALTTEGRVYSWGSNDHDVLGANAASSDQLYPLSVNVFAGTSALFGKTVVAIAGGASHCLALCSDGTVAAWGLNINGQVGDGTNTQRSFPVAVNAASGVSALFGKAVVEIAAGNNHSLALCSDGTLAAWGGNSGGQLGNNTTTDNSVPVLVNAADGTSALFGKTVAAIESATSHNLALCTDGTLVSWGSNASGQLGDNSTNQRLTPVAVNTVSGTSALFGKSVEIIAAGGTSCLALCSDGTLVAWGSNTYGQLGDNSNIGRLAPVAVNTDSGTSALHGKSVRLIAAGGTSSLALCSDGTLATWGENTYGQLGINTTSQRLVPTAVNTSEGVSILAGRKVRQISGASAHQYHYLAVHGLVQEHMSIQGNGVEISHQDATPSVDDHTYFGQANLRGASITRTFIITNLGGLPLTMSGTSWVQVSGAHAADFTVSSLSNTYLDFNESRTFRVTFDPTAIGVRNAELSIANNTVHSNPFTFTIQGKSEDPEITVEQPAGTELSTNGVTNFGEVFPGDSSELVFVIRNTGGDGSLLNGVAATLSGTNASQFSIIGSPVTTLVGPDGSTSFVVRFTPISGGGARTAMLSITSNDMDENPYQIQLTGSVPSSVSAEFSTSSDVCMTLGGLRATGMPVNLTLNFAPEPGTNLTVIKNTGLPFIEGAFSNLANGATVNLSFNGTSYPFVAWYYGGEGNNDLVLLWPRTGVASWGPNSSGQLGDKTTLQRQVPGTVAPIIGPYIQTIVQVATGHDFMVALSTHGELYAWGNNINKQVGYGFAIPYFNYPTYVGDSALFQGRKAVAVAAGHSHSLALFSDGDLMAWGAGSQGQLGNRSTVTSSTPVWVSDQSASSALIFKSVVAVAAGGNHSLALCSDGTLAAWGDNQYGQLGDNTTTDQNEPKAVNTTSGMSALFGRKVIAISAGSDHSLVQCSDGTLVAWGRNTNGQLGINTTVESSLPVLVSTTEGESALFGRTVVSMIASGNQSRALCSDGTMVAWGSNNAGSLGEGTMTDRHTPVMMNPPGGGGALQGKSIMAFTGNQALCSDGTLAAWGYNLNGQIGDNTTMDRPTPVVVNTENGVSVLAGRKIISLGGPGTFGSPSAVIYGMDVISKISLQGNGTIITHGDTTPSSADDTDFGGANVTGGSVVRTFSVRNLELLPLTLTGSPKVAISGPHASDFTVTTQPASPLGSFYGSSNFQITFNPSAIGERSATVSIANNDESTPVFTFGIIGSGEEPELVLEQPMGTGLVNSDQQLG